MIPFIIVPIKYTTSSLAGKKSVIYAGLDNCSNLPISFSFSKMSTAAAANTIRNSAMTPTRMFFRTSQTIPSMAHARTVFKALGEYGDMIEYKFLRVRSYTWQMG